MAVSAISGTHRDSWAVQRQTPAIVTSTGSTDTWAVIQAPAKGSTPWGSQG